MPYIRRRTRSSRNRGGYEEKEEDKGGKGGGQEGRWERRKDSSTDPFVCLFTLGLAMRSAKEEMRTLPADTDPMPVTLEPFTLLKTK